MALLSAAPDLRSLIVHMDDLPLHHVSFVRMLSGLRRLWCSCLLPKQRATNADQLIEPLIRGLHGLEELTLHFTGALAVAHAVDHVD